MKARSIITALIIILIPFILGLALLLTQESQAAHQEINIITDTRKSNKGITHKKIKIDWTFCPDLVFKPLLAHPDEYIVIMFHYANKDEHGVYLMPSYTFVSPGNRRYSANEEISMYIEDNVENKLKVKDQTPISFELPPDATRHYLVTFEKPRSMDNFFVDVDVFRDATLRIYYKKEGVAWVNYKSELINKYKGRG